VPTAAPWVTALLMGVLVLCAAGRMEAWPLTGWELFSRVRTGEQHGWLATETVGGDERPVPFGDLPRGFHNSGHVLERFPAMSPDERRAVCQAWRDALAARRPSQPVEAIRVYRTVSRIPLNGDPPVITRTLFRTCEFLAR